jgi:SHS2 domain-containing protein
MGYAVKCRYCGEIVVRTKHALRSEVKALTQHLADRHPEKSRGSRSLVPLLDAFSLERED